MKTRKCKCGRLLYKPHNSTIWPDKCPKCKMMDELNRKPEKNGKTGKTASKKKSPHSCAMNLADVWFSRYIRLKYSVVATDGTVLCKCIITGCMKPANEMDNGHCFSREYMATRYYEDNCRPQNRSSNRFSGEADHRTFEENLTREIGEEKFDELKRLSYTTIDATLLFFKEIAGKYKTLTNQLLKEKGAKKWW